MALDDVLVGSNLDPAVFDVGGRKPNLVTLKLSPTAFTTDANGDLSVIVPDGGGSSGGDRVTAGGVDPTATPPTLTLNHADGGQVVIGMEGVVTAKELEARSTPLLDVFGAPVKSYRIING